VESEGSHRYSSSRYSRRLRSPLTNCLCSYRRCHSELLNVQKALISYSNRTWRQQFSHRYALRFRRCHTGLPSRNSPCSYFSTFPPSINQLDLVGIRLYFGTENSPLQSSLQRSTLCILAKHKQRFIRMPVKHTTKCHTRCYMDLANLLTMRPATKYHIKLLSTTYVDSDGTPADSSPKYNAEANSAQGQSPA